MANIVATGVDYSWSRPSPVEIKSKGYSVVARYVGNPSSDGRIINIDELHNLFNAGLRVVPIAQYGYVDDPRGGFNRGVQRAITANYGLDLIQWPRSKPVLLAVGDVGTPPNGGASFPQLSDYPAMRDFLHGFQSKCLWPVGIYGPYPVLEAFRNEPVYCYWQTAGGSGPGSGTGGSAYNQGDGSWRRLSSLACMYQEYGSVSVQGTDHNQIFENPFDWSYHPSDKIVRRRGRKKDMTTFQVVGTRPDSEWAVKVFGAPSESRAHTFLMWDAFVRHLASSEEVDNWKIALYVEAVRQNENPDPYYVPSIIIRDEPLDDRWFAGCTLVPHDRFMDPNKDSTGGGSGSGVTAKDKEDIAQRSAQLVHEDLAD
jgi:hypothetical protein